LIKLKSHLLGIGGYLAGFISSKWPRGKLCLLGFKEAIPDLLLLAPVHLCTYFSQFVFWNTEECFVVREEYLFLNLGRYEKHIRDMPYSRVTYANPPCDFF